jgi:hypothetical protein
MSSTESNSGGALEPSVNKVLEITCAVGALIGATVSDHLIQQPVSELDEPSFAQQHEGWVNVASGAAGAVVAPILLIALLAKARNLLTSSN